MGNYVFDPFKFQLLGLVSIKIYSTFIPLKMVLKKKPEIKTMGNFLLF